MPKKMKLLKNQAYTVFAVDADGNKSNVPATDVAGTFERAAASKIGLKVDIGVMSGAAAAFDFRPGEDILLEDVREVFNATARTQNVSLYLVLDRALDGTKFISLPDNERKERVRGEMILFEPTPHQ